MAESTLPHAHIWALGLAAAEWAYVEVMIHRLIWRLSRIDENLGACITTELGLVTLSDILKSIANERAINSDKNELIAIATEFNRLRIERNKYIHARWIAPFEFIDGKMKRGKLARLTITAKGKLQTTEHSAPSFEEIQKIAQEMTLLIVRIHEAYKRMPQTP